ncbi:MAG: hypothetical protein MRY49_01525 [Candidatus Pacebacteria bacterium]|nr:hypothetical protein [Candidatus Paceibacterota bacterium]
MTAARTKEFGSGLNIPTEGIQLAEYDGGESAPEPADLGKYPMEQEAYRWCIENFSRHLSRKMAVRLAKALRRQITIDDLKVLQWWAEFSQHLPFGMICRLVEALGRMICVEELQALVGYDGDEEKLCALIGKKFRPKFWIMVSTTMINETEQAAKRGEGIIEVIKALDDRRKITRLGHRFHIRGQAVWVSGVPFYVDEYGDHSVHRESPLAQLAVLTAKKMEKPVDVYFGLSQIEMDLRHKRKQAEAQEKQRQANERARQRQAEKNMLEENLAALFADEDDSDI